MLIDGKVASWEFQFLMVQLKADLKPNFNKLTPISIPYGSIKRRTLRKKPKPKNAISIPYGSIKSYFDTGQEADGNGFQFLMVQLKVSVRFLRLIDPTNFNSLWFN